jgi:hypothetical protein
MMDYTTIISIAGFILVLVLLVLLRAKNSKFEVKTTDIAVAVLPVVFFLLVTGKIQKFEFGEFRLETVFREASATAVASQVAELTGLPSEPISINPKLGVDQIPRLIKNKTEGLQFRLGYGHYWAPAIKEYLTELTQYPYLQYIIIEKQDGTFFAMAHAQEFAALLTKPDTSYTTKDFERSLNTADEKSLEQVPGLIFVDNAIKETTDKSQALQKMEALNVDTLPVLSEEGRFTGIVNQSRLTASLIIDVSKQLKGE